MKIRTLCLFPAIVASLAIAAVPALATTWNLLNDFNAASVTGVWSYGTANTTGSPARDIDPTSYTFTADTVAQSHFHDNVAGYTYAQTGSGNKFDTGEPIAWIGLCQATDWVFTTVPGVYVAPYGSSNLATDIRWTAPTAGTYSFSGTNANIKDSSLYDYIVKVQQDGTRTVLFTTGATSLAVGATDTFSGSGIAMGAGDVIDFVSLQRNSSNRVYGLLNIQITGGDVPEPGSMLALATGLISLGGLALRRRK